MLVLSRKIGEEIVIGDNIRVRVLSIEGRQIRLGFIAPRSVAIQREELLKAVAQTPQAGREGNLPHPDAIVQSSLNHSLPS